MPKWTISLLITKEIVANEDDIDEKAEFLIEQFSERGWDVDLQACENLADDEEDCIEE